MLTLAKPLAGGLPMGAVLMTDADRVDDQAGRPRHDVRRRSVRGVASRTTCSSDSSDPALLQHVARDRRVVRQAAHRDRASHGRIRAVRGIGFMWGIDVMGTAAHVVQRGVRRRAAHLLGGRVHRAPAAAARRDARRAARSAWRFSKRFSDDVADVVIRRARPEDAEAIARLIAAFADEALMLRRTPEMVELAIDDYVVARRSARRASSRAARSRNIRRRSPRSRRSPCRATCTVRASARAIVERGRDPRDQARHLRRVRAHAAAGVLRRDRLSARRPRALSGEDPAATVSAARAGSRATRSASRRIFTPRLAPRREAAAAVRFEHAMTRVDRVGLSGTAAGVRRSCASAPQRTLNLRESLPTADARDDARRVLAAAITRSTRAGRSADHHRPREPERRRRLRRSRGGQRVCCTCCGGAASSRDIPGAHGRVPSS